MSISGIGTRSALGVQSLVEMRRQLDDLQRQLGTGKKSDTYAGLGLDRGLAVGLRSRLSALEAFRSSITNVDVRLDLAQTSLGRLGDIGRTVKSAAFQSSIDRQQRLDHRAVDRLFQPERDSRPAQHAGRRPLHVLRPRRRPAVGRELRRTSWTATARAPASSRSCRSASRPISARCGRGRMAISAPTATSVQVAEERRPAVRLQARQHHLDARQFHGDRPGRRAAGDVGRSHRPAQCRRDRPVPLHPARWVERGHHADRDDLGHAGRRTSSRSVSTRPPPPPICRPR